jgi:hypothetical protein
MEDGYDKDSLMSKFVKNNSREQEGGCEVDRSNGAVTKRGSANRD